jgi:serine phosphatase RsbU (regulator of sigma subunit)
VVPVSRALVVDDDPFIGRLVEVRLKGRGFRVERAEDGRAALEWLEREPVDLLFLDVSMPRMGGLEVLEQVRARGLDLAVVMMTAFGSEDVAIEALRLGADDYLRKPFESAEFQAIVRRTVARLELGRQNEALRAQLDEKRRQLEAELSRAAVVQAELLPRDRPSVTGFDLAGGCLPAREVGGDFYDWLEHGPGDLTLTLGDVMGKGMPAALLTATVRAALRAVAGRHEPAAALELAQGALADDLARSDSFVTLFHARLDAGRRRVAYVDAGHGHHFVRRADGRLERLSERGLPLGVLPDERYEEGVLELAPGDMLVLYSDGLVEGRVDPGAEHAVLAGRLEGAASASEMVSRLMEAAGGASLTDDVTVVVLRCVG